MTTPSKTGDSGIAAAVTVRASVFGPGMPAAASVTDFAVATTTTARPDCFNPPSPLTNPPSAAADRGSS